MAATDPGAATHGSRGDGPPRVLLCVTGGIAAYKAALLARLLVQRGADVTVLMTESATRFVGPDTFAALTRNPVHHGVFERPETVLHVRLAHAADVAVVAPATANVLAKLALGLADDLVSAALLEATCPLVIAPAMHSGMWNHPATRRNVATLVERGAAVVGPETGPLAAGDEGVGRMAAPEEIEAAVLDALLRAGNGAVPATDLAGARILVSAGPTHEPIDAVRFIGNRSSGTMGFAIACEAARRGASVTLVTGPVAMDDPRGVEVVRVETAAEMLGALQARFEHADALVMAAAVADFRPERSSAGKIKKEQGVPEIRLERTADILATLAKARSRQVLVGFAAETADVPGGLEAEGRRKLEAKGADLLVVNEVGRPGTGFGSATDRAAIIDPGGDDTPLEDWTKQDLARAICDRLAVRLAKL
jgi:phosphopantothenoylcysteine decarboxylase/phosphopantothenate--cysteine ligase